jgi:poly(hydroxyalkanoate) granule-associated protein
MDMTTKRTKQSPAANRTPNDQARTLWLAGLGAFSLAQKRGRALLSGLIAEGSHVQTHAQKLVREVGVETSTKVHEAVAPFRAGFKRNIQKVGAAVQHGVAGALARLGIPSKADVVELTQRVAALSKQLKTAK